MADDESKSKEPIWSINPNWKDRFYGVLLACGFGVSIFTVWTLCGNETSESWIDIFDAVWNGIVGSVVVVWFLFQAVDWAIPRVKKHIYKIMAWGDPYREALRKEALQKMRQEEQERREQFAKEVVKLLEKNNAPQADIQQVQYISDSLKPPNYP